MKKLISILVAMAMMLSLTVIAAFAEGTVPETKDLSKAILTKTLDVPADVTSPAATFHFTFTPAEGTAAGTPTGLTKDIVFTSGTGSQTKNFPLSDLFTLGESGNIKAAGVYIFTVDEDETASEFTKVDATGANEVMEYDPNTYTLRIYVVNDTTTDSGLNIKNITVEDDTTDEKVDPKEKTETITDPTTGETTTQGTGASDFLFTNVYTKDIKTDPTDPEEEQKNGAFNIGKVVDATGMADKTASYPFTVTLKLDEATTNKAGKEYVGKVGTTEYKFTFAQGETEKTVSEIMLKDGEKLVFDLFPAGATATITEDLSDTSIQNKEKYYQTVTGATAQGETAGKNADLIAKTAVINDKASVTVTNKLDADDITPTGILMNNLPYIVLALVAIGGLVAYVVVRRRQADEA